MSSRFKSKHQTPQQTQSQTGDELALQMLASKTEDDIHYGEMDFSPTPQQTQNETGEELAFKDPASKTEERGEDIHYGEIDFSKRRPAPPSDPAQDSGQQQDTLYAQVKVSQPANSFTQTAGGSEDLYAQVKKK